MFRLQPGRNGRAVGIGHIFNRVESIDVRDDALDLFGIVTEFFQRRFYRLIDDLQHPAAGEQLVFYERDIRFDSGRVAIHQKADRASRSQHRDLARCDNRSVSPIAPRAPTPSRLRLSNN